MPKASTRFRNRKINFKTRIGLVIGSLDAPSDHEDDEFAFEEHARPGAGQKANQPSHVETGVDKEEESEHHLQAVINASTAALGRPAGVGTSGKAGEPHIPIPDATGQVDPDAYHVLYGRPDGSRFALPSTYIRFSDTVEEATGHVSYAMDEDDESWLDAFNAHTHGSATNGSANGHVSGCDVDKVANGHADDPSGGRGRRGSPRKGKEKEKVEDAGPEERRPGPLDENDFELLMDAFERVTDETVPGLHLDTSRLPSLSDFDKHLEDGSLHPRLPSTKIFAKFVYAHWKERRLKRGGRPIIPQLDFDESNDNNPYVCFRRREIKNVRKTRRTDAQNLERLARLKADLEHAHELLYQAAERERLKREMLQTEKAIFDGRNEVRELKRKLGEADGDEDLLVGKREKRPRPSRISEVPGIGTIKIPLPRHSRGGISSLGPLSPTAINADLNAIKDRAAGITRSIEKELLRRRDGDSGWEDWTDSAYQPLPLSQPTKMWRAPAPPARGEPKDAGPSFERNEPVGLPGVIRLHLRRRVGRGGRMMLDRILPHQRRSSGHTQLGGMISAAIARKKTEYTDSDEEAEKQRLRDDRFRFDDEARLDFPASTDAPIVDDFNIGFTERRRQLLLPQDIQYLDTDGDAYIRRAQEWLDRAPDPEPPVVKVGRLPVKQAVAVGSLTGLSLGANPMAARQMPPGSSAVHEQMMAAAAHGAGLGLGGPAGFRRLGTGGKGPIPMLPQSRRTPSGSSAGGSGPQLTPQQMQLLQQQQLQAQIAQLNWQQQQQQQAQQVAVAAAAAAAQGQPGPGATQGSSSQAQQHGSPPNGSFPAVTNQLLSQFGQIPGQNGLIPRMTSQLQLNAQLNGLPIGMAGRSPMMQSINRTPPMPNGIGRPGSAHSDIHRSPALGPQQNGPASSPRPGSAASPQHNMSPITNPDALPPQMQHLSGSPAMQHANPAKRPNSALGLVVPSQSSPSPGINGSMPQASSPHMQALQAAMQQQARQAATAAAVAGINGQHNGLPHGLPNGLPNGMFGFPHQSTTNAP